MRAKPNRRVMLQSALSTTAMMNLRGGYAQDQYPAGVVDRHDEDVRRLMQRQITDQKNRWFGGYPNHEGLVNPHSAGHLFEMLTAAFLCPQSSHYQSDEVKTRIRYAADHLRNAQNEEGNIDLLTTNFNSPPDTGFVVHRAATGARLAQRENQSEILDWILPFLRKAGSALSVGGVHTPNHRWVICAALAQIHEIIPQQAYLDRMDQWLQESIDIDEDGMYTERSTTVYNAVTDNALVTLADKLHRPELLEPVRTNLNAMRYLLHANGEVVTEISRRQDVNTQGDMRRYWFALRYLAVQDQNSEYAAMLKPYEPDQIHLPLWMEYPHLQASLPSPKSLPAAFQKRFEAAGITRIRDQKLSATLIHTGSSRFFSLHYGKAVINAVRMAAAFFGKGQFIPEHYEYRNGVHHFQHALQGPYYQPLQPPRRVEADGKAWSLSRLEREQSEICSLEYHVQVIRTDSGFDLNLQADGTSNVPLAVEINVRDGGRLSGVENVAHTEDAWVLSAGMAVYTVGEDRITFGPGMAENTSIQIRGAQEKLSGQSVYLTSYTPFEQTIRFEVS